MRTPEYPVDNLFIDRVSTRSFNAEDMPESELMSIFEAAKWAPSSRNEQPWRFLYSRRNDQYWNDFVSIMDEYNQVWAKNASVLILVVSKNNFNRDDTPNRHLGFDTGSAWMSLAFQARLKGYVIHPMGGIDVDKAKSVCEIPEDYTVQCMVALGTKGRIEDLPENLHAKETPSQRRPLKETVMNGRFMK
jgi:nitroreductase